MSNPLPDVHIDLPHEHTEGHPGLLWSVVNAYVLFVAFVVLIYSLNNCLVRKRKDGTLFRFQRMHAFVLGATLLGLIAFAALVFYPGFELKKPVRLFLDQYAWLNALMWFIIIGWYVRRKWEKISRTPVRR